MNDYLLESEKYLLTVIVPVYNTELYLKECLESLVEQSCSDFCVLLIDDGSTDNCGGICDKYAQSYSFINVIHKKNGGLCSVRNLGMEKVTTEWFAFIDSDDFVSKTYIEGLLESVRNNSKLDFVQAGCLKYIDEKTILECQSYDYYVGDDKALVFNLFRGLSCSKLFKTEIVRKYNLTFDSKLVYAEDYIFTLEYLCYVNKYCLSPEVGYYYRQVEGSLSRTICMDCEKLSYYICKKYSSAAKYIEMNSLDSLTVDERLKKISSDLSWLIDIIIANRQYENLKNMSTEYSLVVRKLSRKKQILLLFARISVSLSMWYWRCINKIERLCTFSI